MKIRALFLAIPLILGALPDLSAQTPANPGQGQPTQERLHKRDGSCKRAKQGRGQRKLDGTGPRAGTPACPRTPRK